MKGVLTEKQVSRREEKHLCVHLFGERSQSELASIFLIVKEKLAWLRVQSLCVYDSGVALCAGAACSPFLYAPDAEGGERRCA